VSGPDEPEQPLADVEIGAAASARKLRFRNKPQTEVGFAGRPDQESDSHTERENLPEEVEPGIIYRDVRVRWRAGARIGVEELPAEEG